MEYASNAKANAGLATGIIGTVLGGLSSMGGLAALTGVNTNPEDTAVTRHELNYVQALAEKDHTIAKFEAAQYTDAAIKSLSDQMAVKFNQIDNKFIDVNNNLNTQAILNATQTSTMQCMQNQINTLMSMTQIIIPNANVMPGWGNVTISPAGATTVKGAVPSAVSNG